MFAIWDYPIQRDLLWKEKVHLVFTTERRYKFCPRHRHRLLSSNLYFNNMEAISRWGDEVFSGFSRSFVQSADESATPKRSETGRTEWKGLENNHHGDERSRTDPEVHTHSHIYVYILWKKRPSNLSKLCVTCATVQCNIFSCFWLCRNGFSPKANSRWHTKPRRCWQPMLWLLSLNRLQRTQRSTGSSSTRWHTWPWLSAIPPT